MSVPDRFPIGKSSAPKDAQRVGCTRLRVIGKPSTMSRTALVHHTEWTQFAVGGKRRLQDEFRLSRHRFTVLSMGLGMIQILNLGGTNHVFCRRVAEVQSR
jgi:hypothetical protein